MRTLLLVLIALGCFGCTKATTTTPTKPPLASLQGQPVSITHLTAPPGWKIQRLEGTVSTDGNITQLPTVVLVRSEQSTNTQLASR